MVRRSKEHMERKMQILETAERLFIEYGYDETPVEMIIKEVGIAKGTFYHYFHSKDELLDIYVDRLIVEVTENIVKITAGDGDAVEKLFALSNYFRTLAIGKERITDFIHEERNAHIHLKIEKRIGPEMVECYTSLVEQGIEEGHFNMKYPRDTALA
jgi:AcrR family transcriptional regulator